MSSAAAYTSARLSAAGIWLWYLLMNIMHRAACGVTPAMISAAYISTLMVSLSMSRAQAWSYNSGSLSSSARTAPMVLPRTASADADRMQIALAMSCWRCALANASTAGMGRRCRGPGSIPLAMRRRSASRMAGYCVRALLITAMLAMCVAWLSRAARMERSSVRESAGL